MIVPPAAVARRLAQAERPAYSNKEFSVGYRAFSLLQCTLNIMCVILGQEAAMTSLRSSIHKDRGHHALIFCGPRGTGKCTAAVNYASELLNISREMPERFPDLHVIRKEDVVWSQNPSLQRRKQTNIPIDLLRERMIGGRASDGVFYDAVVFKTPTIGRKKVFIVDEAELLDEAGQNALLKTLEEPPAGTTIILVTCREDLLLPTIQSRCQCICFSPLDESSMATWVDGLVHDMGASDLSWAVDFSCGSPGLLLDATTTGLPSLYGSISSFLSLENCEDYTGYSSKIISFIDDIVTAKLSENPLASKNAVNRWAVELVLQMFGNASRVLTRGGGVEDGILAAAIVADVERQLSTNISTRVLLESLAARWSVLCVGDSVFV